MSDFITNSELRIEAERLCDENERLTADNARLRELVRGMYKAFMHGNCYRWCGFKESCNHILDCKCQWYDRMRELGVTDG